MKKSDLANGVSYRFILKMFQAGEIQGISDAFARLFFAAVASAAVIGCGIRVFARNYFVQKHHVRHACPVCFVILHITDLLH